MVVNKTRLISDLFKEQDEKGKQILKEQQHLGK
jgi:hypothetical protein